MTSIPQPDKTVVLSLSADPSSGSDVLFPERRITLHHGKESVIIGRASKVSVKGYVAGIENAWFHSAVMSRHHAQLFASMDRKKVEIKDLGSLHGTFLNGDERIPAEQLREIKDGDIIRFGAPIWRGTDQFVPTTVKVAVEFPNHDGSSTFQVPDESDDEESDDDQSRDSGKDTKLKSNGRHPTAQSSSSQTKAVDARVIDLTGAHTSRQTRHIIDLSSPPGSPIRVDEDEEPAGIVDSGNDEMEDGIDGQVISPELGKSTVHGNPGDKTGAPDGMTEAHQSGSLSVNPIENLPYDIDDYPLAEDDDISLSAETDDDSQIDYPDEESDSQSDSFDDSTSDDEDMNDIESLDSMVERSDEMDLEDYSSDDDGLAFGPEDDHGDAYWDDFPPRLPILDYPEIVPLVESLSRPLVAITSSQAAAVVSASSQIVPGGNTVASIDWLLNSDNGQSPVAVSQQEPSTSPPATKTAEVLGAKTGKIDYFLARDENKMALETQKAVGPRPTSVQDLCNDDEAVDESRSYGFGPTAHISSPFSPVSLGGGADDCSRRTYVGISDIVNKYQPNPCEAAFAAQISPPTPPAAQKDEQHDHGLHERNAEEILNAAAADVEKDRQQRNRGEGKRKADDISSATPEEERWAAAFATPVEEQSQPEPPLPHEDLVGELAEPSEHSGGDLLVSPPQTPERPVKRARMMRVAERLGYAALGGVTAGAMIVGTLIYTAPTFG